MPPKGSTKANGVAKSAKSDATAKKTATKAAAKPKAATTKTTTAAKAPAKSAPKAVANGVKPAPGKKRKAADDDDEDKSSDADPEPKAKKPKTAAKDTKAAKAAPKKTAKIKAKEATPEEDETEDKPEKAEDAAVASEPEPEPEPAPKAKAKPAPRAKATRTTASDIGPKINEAPTDRLDIYVFGDGCNGELGLGSKRVDGKKPTDVKRPRLNPFLAADKVGIVQVACGGMHAAALTHDSRIYTWGVNDQGALGRDTAWEGGLRNMDDESDDESSDGGSDMNPLESTPTAVPQESFPEGTKFVQVAASDSATFALTEDGRVYGWGTFRSSDGILGFSRDVKVQRSPVLVPELKKITSLAAGSNHILAVDQKGGVIAWGCGQQNQLGRRIIERQKLSSLVPQSLGIARVKVSKIACGSYHSFALDKKGDVYGWGLNNYGETGIDHDIGVAEAVVLKPSKLVVLKGRTVVDIAGGEHHSVCCTDKGEVLTWGRTDSCQVGLPADQLTADNAIYDEHKKPRILFQPTVLPHVKDAVFVAAGTDHCIALTGSGQVYAWGFSASYQTGVGGDDDVEVPTLVENSAIKGKKIVWAGAGGQFSMLAAVSAQGRVNGTHP